MSSYIHYPHIDYRIETGETVTLFNPDPSFLRVQLIQFSAASSPLDFPIARIGRQQALCLEGDAVHIRSMPHSTTSAPNLISSRSVNRRQ